MSSDRQQHDPRHIHKTLSRSTTFWGDYTIGELFLFGTPIALVLVILGIPFVPSSAVLPLVGLALAIEVLLWILHKTSPSYMRLTEWLLVRLQWAVKDEQYDLGGAEETGILTPDGGADTADSNRLKRVTPTSVIRTDGAHVGAMRVRPANMALKDDESWNSAIRSLAKLANGALDKNMQAKIYSPTRQVDNKEFIRDHRQRLKDDDVQNLPVLRELLKRFVDRHTTDEDHIIGRESIIREYYIIIWVTEDTIETTETDDSVWETLRDIRLIGSIVNLIKSEGLSEEEYEELKAERLEDKLKTLSSSIDDLYQCSGESVTGPELGELLAEYHTCRPVDFEDPDAVFGNTSIPHKDIESDEEAEFDEDDAEEEVESDSDSEDSSEEFVDPSTLKQPDQQHQAAIAPTSIDWARDHVVVEGGTYSRMFWIEDFPEDPEEGLFENILLSSELQADVSIYLNPYGSRSAVDLISDWISTLRVNQEKMGSLKAEDAEVDINRAKYIRQLVRRNKTSMFKLGVFIRITAENEEELRQKTNKLESKLLDAPTNCIPKRISRRPEEGWVTCSPIGANELGSDRLSAATGEAIGAMFPFSSNYMRMSDGIEYGLHTDNGSQVHINPWDLETGHSELITGTPGSGKTHGAQARGLRMLKRKDDVKQVIVDPPGDMRGTAAELDAKMITVSGDTPLNPFEMHPTPEDIMEASDMNPVTAKKQEGYAFIENFLQSQSGVALEMRSGLVTYIIDRIFEESGIDPNEPSTHTPENSPTMDDFLEVVNDVADHPEQFSDSPRVQDKVADYAAELRVALQAFTEGSTHENMAEESQLNALTSDDKVVYLDLTQVEGSSDGLGKQSYIMQLLLTKIYQQAKVIDDRVEVIIDEAYYLFNDQANLEFLTQIARHQRHAGLRLIMLSQTLDDFYDTDKEVVEKIAGMCPIQVHHREPHLDSETAEDAKLTSEQEKFIKEDADAGKKSEGENDSEGYSNALVRVDEHGDYPIRIETSDAEKAIIEYEKRDGLLAQLQDSDDGLDEFRDLLGDRYLQNMLDANGFAEETIERLLNEGLTDKELLTTLKLVIEQYGDEFSLDPAEMDDTTGLDEAFEAMADGAGASTNGDSEEVAQEPDDWGVFEVEVGEDGPRRDKSRESDED